MSRKLGRSAWKPIVLRPSPFARDRPMSSPSERLILVIGDSPDHLTQVTAILGQRDYGQRVEAIADFPEALAQLQLRADLLSR